MACDSKTILKMARSAMREEDYLLLLAQLQTTFNVTFVGFLLKNTVISFYSIYSMVIYNEILVSKLSELAIVILINLCSSTLSR